MLVVIMSEPVPYNTMMITYDFIGNYDFIGKDSDVYI